MKGLFLEGLLSGSKLNAVSFEKPPRQARGSERGSNVSKSVKTCLCVEKCQFWGVRGQKSKKEGFGGPFGGSREVLALKRQSFDGRSLEGGWKRSKKGQKGGQALEGVQNGQKDPKNT